MTDKILCSQCHVEPANMRGGLCFRCFTIDHPAFSPWHKRPTARRRIKYAVITFFLVVVICVFRMPELIDIVDN